MTPKFSSLKLNVKTELKQQIVFEGQESQSGLTGGSGSGSLMKL